MTVLSAPAARLVNRVLDQIVRPAARHHHRVDRNLLLPSACAAFDLSDLGQVREQLPAFLGQQHVQVDVSVSLPRNLEDCVRTHARAVENCLTRPDNHPLLVRIAARKAARRTGVGGELVEDGEQRFNGGEPRLRHQLLGLDLGRGVRTAVQIAPREARADVALARTTARADVGA